MKACVLHGVGDLRVGDVAKPVPKRGETLVRIGACGVCGSDVPRVFVKGTYRFPLIPGHEFAGEIVGVGEGGEPGLMSTRVVVFPLIPCRKCPSCAIEAYAQCEAYDYLGSRCDGAFAEYVCAPVWNTLLLPSNVSFEEAAMAEPAAVALHALRRGEIREGDSVLIVGAGPIGLLLGLWSRLLGAATVLLADIDDSKLAFARQIGFEHVFNPVSGDTLRWLRESNTHGANLVIEASGSSAGYELCLRAANPFGRVVLLGNPSGAMTLSQDGYWAILRKELRVVGAWNSRFCASPRDEWSAALDAMAAGRLDVKPLITHRVPLETLPQALTMMKERNEFFCKVMMVSDTNTTGDG